MSTAGIPGAEDKLLMSNRLPVLAAEIRCAHADAQDAAKTMVQRAIDAGKLLHEAKELVKHGEWLPWLRANCEMSERTAQLYMRLASKKDELAKAQPVADLTLRAAARAASGTISDDDVEVAKTGYPHWIEWKLARICDLPKPALLMLMAQLDYDLPALALVDSDDLLWDELLEIRNKLDDEGRWQRAKGVCEQLSSVLEELTAACKSAAAAGLGVRAVEAESCA